MAFIKKIVNITASKTISFSSMDIMGNICLVSLGETSISQNEIQSVTISNQSSFSLTGYTQKVVNSFFATNKEASIYILELGATDSGSNTIDTKATTLQGLIQNKTINNYLYLMPSAFLASDNMVTLASAYNDINDSIYFAFSIAQTTQISSDSNLKKFVNLKSVLFVYNQLSITTNDDILGIFAGTYISKFSIISSENKMRPFDYLFVNYNMVELNDELVSTLEDANIIYFSPLIGKQSFINVKTQDGEFFSSSIAYDILKLRLNDRITNAIVNNANKNNSAIDYSNNGILLLKSIIEEELSVCKDLKLILEYGAFYNDTTQEIENLNEIYYTPFLEYKKANSENYNNSIYGGYIINIRLAKFILVCNLSINLV